ncbi:MAG: hypothetical protein M3467_05845 [Actinomycetota bacterium]|nr:hypothetical protein [Actinomycetota bacterium]
MWTPTRRAFLGASVPALLAVTPTSAAAATTAGPPTVLVDPPTGDPQIDTAAVLAAFAECKRRAARAYDIGGGRTRYLGLPTLELRHGDYALNQSLRIKYTHGFRIRGQGRWATRIVWSAPSYLLHIERSGAIEVSGLRVSGQSGTSTSGQVMGLAQDSGFCRVVERSDDGVGAIGGSTLMLIFAELGLEELHRGWSFEGNAMTDGVAFERIRTRDVFEGWAYRNSQAVNHTFRHVEFISGVSFDPSVYQPRLDTWRGRPTFMDGAAFVIQSGGKATLEGCSFITTGPTFRIQDPPQDGSQLAITNILPWTLVGCSWELRTLDQRGDRNGLQRTAVILPETPYPAPGTAASQCRFNFYGCDWYSKQDSRVLFYLRNGNRIRVRDSRASYLGAAATRHRLHCLVNAGSAGRPGAYLSDAATKLKVTKSATATTGNPHRVRQSGGKFS